MKHLKQYFPSKKALVTFSVLAFSLLFPFSGHGQKIMQDSRGKDIFEYYKGGALQATLVPTQTSLELSYNQVLGNPFFYYINGDTTQKTIGASRSISFSGKIAGSGTNQGKPFNATNGLVRPSYRLEVGYQRNLNIFYHLKHIPSGRPFTYMAGGNIYGEYQNINFYDTKAQIQSNKRPFIFGAHGHVTIFHARSVDQSALSSVSWAISFSGDLSQNYNQDGLIPYQERKSDTYIDPNVISVGDVIGNIGTFDRALSYRFRAAIPIFINEYVNVTPYGSLYGYGQSNASFLPGLAFNFLSGSPLKENSSLAQGFGVALDWPRSSGVWKPAVVSLYGTFKLDLLKKALIGKSE
jgi:hypothetical protein